MCDAKDLTWDPMLDSPVITIYYAPSLVVELHNFTLQNRKLKLKKKVQSWGKNDWRKLVNYQVSSGNLEILWSLCIFNFITSINNVLRQVPITWVTMELTGSTCGDWQGVGENQKEPQSWKEQNYKELNMPSAWAAWVVQNGSFILSYYPLS